MQRFSFLLQDCKNCLQGVFLILLAAKLTLANVGYHMGMTVNQTLETVIFPAAHCCQKLAVRWGLGGREGSAGFAHLLISVCWKEGAGIGIFPELHVAVDLSLLVADTATVIGSLMG